MSYESTEVPVQVEPSVWAWPPELNKIADVVLGYNRIRGGYLEPETDRYQAREVHHPKKTPTLCWEVFDTQRKYALGCADEWTAKFMARKLNEKEQQNAR